MRRRPKSCTSSAPNEEAPTSETHTGRAVTASISPTRSGHLTDLVFSGWDIFRDNSYQTAVAAGVLPAELVVRVRDALEAVQPWPGVFERAYVPKLSGTHFKRQPTKMHLAEAVMHDIEAFMAAHWLQRAVMIWCGSTEVYLEPSAVHQTLGAFEQGLKENAAEISPSMIYAYAALTSGIPLANGAPNLTVDIPALVELSAERHLPIAGKDLKTGQTLLKTGWGNRCRSKSISCAGTQFWLRRLCSI